MKSFAACALVLLAATGVLATQQATHIHVRVHSATHSKLYITPMGEQCAYNASIDPAEYPCRDGGVCVRTNATYGECRLPASQSDSGSGSDDSDSVELPTDSASGDDEDSQSSDDDEDDEDFEDEDDSVDNTLE